MKNVLSMDKLGNRMNAAKEQISSLKESVNGLSQKVFKRDKSLEENREKLRIRILVGVSEAERE